MVEDLYALPASYGQEWMWLVAQAHRGGGPYHIGGALRISGPVDPGALERALTLLVERHEALRTVFRLEPAGDLSQVVRAAAPVELPVVEPGDLADAAPGGRLRWALAWVEEFSDLPFDLAEGPLLRAALIRLGPDDHVFALVFHHIVMDGWSLGVAMGELGEMYRRLVDGLDPRLPEPPLQYPDFAVWQRDWLGSGVMDEQLRHWRAALAGARPVDLAADPLDEADRTPVRAHPLHLRTRQVVALGELARSERTTVFTVLLGALATVLARWSGQADLVLSTPVAGRTHPELERTVGLFVNTLPLRVDTTGARDFRDVLRRARDSCFAAYSHQDVPFERVVSEVAPRRTRGRVPLSPVMLALRNQPMPVWDQIPGATVEPIEQPPITGGFDFFVEVVEEAGGEMRGHVAGDGERYGRATVAALADALVAVLARVGEGADIPLDRLPIPARPSGTPDVPVAGGAR